MRIRAECIPCLLTVRMKEILESSLQEEEKMRAVIELLTTFVKHINPEISTIELASKSFSLIKRLLMNSDPYKEYKSNSNSVVESLTPIILSHVENLSLHERLKALFIISINANILDPGAPPFTKNLEQLKLGLLDDKLTLDDTGRILSLIEKSRRILYILDNAGEAVIDKLIISELVSTGKNVIVLAKGGAYQNDITYEEALEMDFGEVAEVMSTGSDHAAVLLDRASSKVLEVIKSVDLIIAKGMANYEAFLYTPPPTPVAHLFIAKCKPVASTLNVPVGSKIALLRL